jgi:hypothetical protein
VTLTQKPREEHSELAISGEVKLPGVRNKISSGEELLKSWILLNSLGHMNYTFGTERIILNYCIEKPSFYDQLITFLPQGTRRWANGIVKNYEYEQFFKILSFFYITHVGNSRKRNLFTGIYKSIVLPFSDQTIKASDERTKIIRLQNLYRLIRLISQLTIDSFYSHSPITLELNQVLLNLDKEILSRRKFALFTQMLKNIASIIARETYLHPSSLALIGKYEIEGRTKIAKRDWKNNFYQFIATIHGQGLGIPKLKKWDNFIRITLTKNYLPKNKVYQSALQIYKCIDDPKCTNVTIINNHSANEQYIDVSTNLANITVAKSLKIIQELTKWFLFRAEIAARAQLINYKKSVPTEMRKHFTEIFEQQRVEYIKEYTDEFTKHSRDILKAVIKLLIKSEYSFAIPCPTIIKSAGIIVFDSKGNKYSNIDSVYEQHKMYFKDNKDRLKEVECIKSEADNLKRNAIAICCFAPVTILNVIGKKIDEWDGVLICITKNKLELRILEVKNTGISSCSEAFKQLKKTKTYLRNDRYHSATRQRITGFGARLRII